MEYTTQWVEKCNRGGLSLCNHEFYLFIRTVESTARLVLNTSFMINYCGEDIRLLLLEKFNSYQSIQTKWDNLTRNFSNQTVLKIMKRDILMKWIHLQAFAFVDCWLQIMRQKASKQA